MDFKAKLIKPILFVSLFVVLLVGLIIWRFSIKTGQSAAEGVTASPVVQVESMNKSPLKLLTQDSPDISLLAQGQVSETTKEDDGGIEEQLERDREQQTKTKYLKNQLEQTNLELEQEKALTELNKLKKEDSGAFNDPEVDSPKNMPEITVDYIGGDSVKKEAILSIGGASYQVKEKSNPTQSIQVVSITDTGVTLHFTAPENMTKTIDYKPE